MAKVCDHTSVGMLVWKDDKLLLIERGRGTPGFAVPAGHVDSDKTYEEAAVRELKEEVGLDAKIENLKLLIEGRKENPCRREGGDWHYWKFYQVIATGEIERSQEETKSAKFYSREEIKSLSDKLEPVMREWFKELKLI